MLKAFIFTFLSFALFQLAQAASVIITSPQPNDVLKVGEAVEIKWKLADGASVDKVMIALASGPAQALLIDEVLAPSVSAAEGKFKWKIPTSVKPGKYVVEIGPHSADIAFAGYFNIVKPKAAASASSSVARPSASAKASASGAKKHKPTATLPSSVAHVTPKPTPKPKPTPSKKKAPVRVMCIAYPDEHDEMTTTCRPVGTPTPTETPKVHGTHKRKEKPSTTAEPKETPKVGDAKSSEEDN